MRGWAGVGVPENSSSAARYSCPPSESSSKSLFHAAYRVSWVKKKVSEKIIEILTAKKMRDEKSPANSPALSRRKLSEYVSEKLMMTKSRSGTPSSPSNTRKKY